MTNNNLRNSINARIAARYEGLSFDTEGIKPDKSKNHTRTARRSNRKRRTIR